MVRVYVCTYMSATLLSLMVQVPESDGLPSVQERIDLYCKEVKNRGGTPPTPTAGSSLRYRRFTAPQLDFPDSLLAPKRYRSSSSTDVSQMSHLQVATSMKAMKEVNVSRMVYDASGGMRKPSVLSVQEIEVDFGNGRESDLNNGGGDADVVNNLIVPVPLMVSGQMELQQLREENRLLHKQLHALQSGETLLPCLSEDDPRVSGTCIIQTYVRTVCTVLCLMLCMVCVLQLKLYVSDEIVTQWGRMCLALNEIL